MKCDKTEDGELIATVEQLETFIAELSLDNVLPPVESNFIKMLIGKEGSKSSLKIFDESEENDEFNLSPIAAYENEVMEYLKFGMFLNATNF
jgi:hypothetical protein